MKPLSLPLKRLAVVGLGEVRETQKTGSSATGSSSAVKCGESVGSNSSSGGKIASTPLSPKGVGANLVERLSTRPDLVESVIAVSTDLGKAQHLVEARGVGKFGSRGESVRLEAIGYDSFLSRVGELDPDMIVFCAGNTIRPMRNPDGSVVLNPDGTPRLPSRLELLAQNAPIASRFGSALQGYAGKVLVAANPTDLLSLTIYLSSGMHHLDVLGLNNLDTQRFRQFFLDRYNQEYGFAQEIPYQDLCTLFMVGYHDPGFCLPVVERQKKSSMDLRRLLGYDPLSDAEKRQVELQAADLLAKAPDQQDAIRKRMESLFTRSADDADDRAEWRISGLVEKTARYAFTLFKQFEISTNPCTADEIVSTIEFLAGKVGHGETRVFSTLVKPALLKEVSSSREAVISRNPVNDRWLYCGLPFRRINHESGHSEIVPMLDLSLGDAVVQVQELARNILEGPQKQLGEVLARLEVLPGRVSLDKALESRARPQIAGGSTALVSASYSLPSIDRQIQNTRVRLVARDKNDNDIIRLFSASASFDELKSVKVEGGLQYLQVRPPFLFGVSKKPLGGDHGRVSINFLIHQFDADLKPLRPAYHLGSSWPGDVCQARSLLYVLGHEGVFRCHTTHGQIFTPVLDPSLGLSVPEFLAAVQARDSRDVTVFLGYDRSPFKVGHPVETGYERLVPVHCPGLKELEAYVAEDGAVNLLLSAEEKSGGALIRSIRSYTMGDPSSSRKWSSGQAWGFSPSQGILVASRPDNASLLEVHGLSDRSLHVMNVGMPALGRIAVSYPHAFFRSGDRFAVANLQTGQSRAFQVPLAHEHSSLHQWVIP